MSGGTKVATEELSSVMAYVTVSATKRARFRKRYRSITAPARSTTSWPFQITATDRNAEPFSKRFRIGNDTLSGIFHTQPVCPSLPAVEPER